jgi:hypothetical protein
MGSLNNWVCDKRLENATKNISLVMPKHPKKSIKNAFLVIFGIKSANKCEKTKMFQY